MLASAFFSSNAKRLRGKTGARDAINVEGGSPVVCLDRGHRGGCGGPRFLWCASRSRTNRPQIYNASNSHTQLIHNRRYVTLADDAGTEGAEVGRQLLQVASAKTDIKTAKADLAVAKADGKAKVTSAQKHLSSMNKNLKGEKLKLANDRKGVAQSYLKQASVAKKTAQGFKNAATKSQGKLKALKAKDAALANVVKKADADRKKAEKAAAAAKKVAKKANKKAEKGGKGQKKKPNKKNKKKAAANAKVLALKVVSANQ